MNRSYAVPILLLVMGCGLTHELAMNATHVSGFDLGQVRIELPYQGLRGVLQDRETIWDQGSSQELGALVHAAIDADPWSNVTSGTG